MVKVVPSARVTSSPAGIIVAMQFDLSVILFIHKFISNELTNPN